MDSYGCGEQRKVIIEPLEPDDLNLIAWGDIICTECRLVIATISSDESGVYQFVKVTEVANG